jgi:hypothetical protein
MILLYKAATQKHASSDLYAINAAEIVNEIYTNEVSQMHAKYVNQQPRTSKATEK